MGNQQIEPTGIEGIQEPQETISKEEINQKIKEYWKAVDESTNYQSYKEAFDKLDYYRDLKLKLYK